MLSVTLGNTVRLLTDTAHADTPQQDIFVHVDGLLDQAQSGICLEMFGLDHPDLVDRLARKARAGVPVEIVTDAPRPTERDAAKTAALQHLQAAGAQVHLYPRQKSSQIDHVKLLIVDGRQAILGGMNWGSHSPLNHDYDLLVEGPAVTDLGQVFDADWRFSGGSRPGPGPTAPPAAGDCAVQVLPGDLHDHSLQMALYRHIDSAQHSIHAELFALTDAETITRLQQAHARGVDVRVLLDPLRIGAKRINAAAAQALRAAGIPVRWYHWDTALQDKLHAKAAVFDDQVALVGSANWTGAGLSSNRELDLKVLSAPLCAALETQFSRDWQASTVLAHYPAD